MAPEAIRRHCRNFSEGALHWDFDIGGTLHSFLPNGGRDCGNFNQDYLPFDEYFAAAVRVVKRQLETSTFSGIFGGDHGVTIPVVHALEVVGRPVHLVQIDAHVDWRDECVDRSVDILAQCAAQRNSLGSAA
ncbi:MAG: hypothetical protein E5W30_02295 [Mesorhizobium sp.]|nr:MAG: hypothetical protein E5W30_02295 [Mesorhizobium sp.]